MPARIQRTTRELPDSSKARNENPPEVYCPVVAVGIGGLRRHGWKHLSQSNQRPSSAIAASCTCACTCEFDSSQPHHFHDAGEPEFRPLLRSTEYLPAGTGAWG